MTDAGYYRGTTADQDNRFQDKEKKLMKTLKFSDNLNEPVDMRKVSIYKHKKVGVFVPPAVAGNFWPL